MVPHQFDLNLLRALDALLQERNVTRAAARLHVTQQAMSGSLKRMRELFDDALLERVGKHLEPTPLGAALLQPVHEVMLQIDLVLATTPTFDPGRTTRRFRIAMSDYATVTILPLLMAQLSRTAPGIVCEIQLIDDRVFRDLEAGELDLCLLPSNWRLYQDCKPENILSQTLFGDDFVCVVDRHNPIGDVFDVPAYLSLPHNIVRLGGGVRSIVENAWLMNQITPRIAATTTSFTSLVTMIAGTTMIATVQRRLAMQFAASLGIRLLECPIPVEPLLEDMSWHVRSERDPAHRFLRESFIEAAAGMDAQAAVVPSI